MAVDQFCNYANCMETCERGVVITLRLPDSDGTRASFCCVSHAVASLSRLAHDRSEPLADLPRFWKHH